MAESSSSTETMELPPLAEAMTAADLIAHRNSLQRMVPCDSVYFLLLDHGPGRRFCVSVSPRPPYSTEAQGAHYADTWGEAIAAARAWIASRAAVHRDSRIRAMALAIIDLTDQHGRCDRAILRRREFSDAEIDALKDEACQRAGELAGNAPFAVEG